MAAIENDADGGKRNTKNNRKKKFCPSFVRKKWFLRPLKVHDQKTVMIMFEHDIIFSENLSSCENHFSDFNHQIKLRTIVYEVLIFTFESCTELYGTMRK